MPRRFTRRGTSPQPVSFSPDLTPRASRRRTQPHISQSYQRHSPRLDREHGRRQSTSGVTFDRATMGRGRGRRGVTSGPYRRHSFDEATSESSTIGPLPQSQRRQRRLPRRSRHEEWRELQRLHENVKINLIELERFIDATSPDSEEMEWNQHRDVIYVGMGTCCGCDHTSGRPEVWTSPTHSDAGAVHGSDDAQSSTLQGTVNPQVFSFQTQPQAPLFRHANPFSTAQHQIPEIPPPRHHDIVYQQSGQLQQPAPQSSGQTLSHFDAVRSAAAAGPTSQCSLPGPLNLTGVSGTAPPPPFLPPRPNSDLWPNPRVDGVDEISM